MDNKDKPEFVRVLNGLAAIKHVDLTEEAYEMWWLSMVDWQLSDFTEAAGFLLKNCQFMPAPNDFEDLRKRTMPSAHEAWENAQSACLGWRKKNCKSGDAMTDRVVSVIGGYRQIALCDVDKLMFLEKRFIETYNDFKCGNNVRQALPNLIDRPQLRHDLPVQIGAILKDSASMQTEKN